MAGLRGLGDVYLDAECTQASLKLRQPHDTLSNDDGVLPPLVAIAQSLRVNNALLDAALRARNCVRTCSIIDFAVLQSDLFFTCRTGNRVYPCIYCGR